MEPWEKHGGIDQPTRVFSSESVDSAGPVSYASPGAARAVWPWGLSGGMGGRSGIVKQREHGASRDVRYPVSRILTRAVAGLVVLGLALGAGPAEAARHVIHHPRHRGASFASGPVHESIVIDAHTGQILSEDNPDAITYPASLTKLMTLYLTFQALDQGRLRLDTRLPVSAWAASQSPTKLGLRPGDAVSVRSLILGIVTRSANDAAVVLAEGLGGSEPAFADRMNAEAQRLGMTRTFFRNASGLPIPDQHTTARDMARLGLAILHDFPREYAFFDTKEFNFRGTEIVGHDHLLNWYPGADGMKTGFIRASGFNLVTSAVRDGHRLIGVVLGGTSWAARDREMAMLLDQGFAALAGATPAVAETPAAAAPIPAVARVAVPPVVPARPAPLAAAGRPEPPQPRPAAGGFAPIVRARTVEIRRREPPAQRALRISPVARAQASEIRRPEPLPAARLARRNERGDISRGGKAVRQVSRLTVPNRGRTKASSAREARARARLYRARFAARKAASACAAAHGKRASCAAKPRQVAAVRR